MSTPIRAFARRDCRCLRARHVHGTKRAYMADGCRCDECRAANATWSRAYRRIVARRRWNGGSAWTDSTGTARRLRALAVAGWSAAELGPHLGVTDSAVFWLRKQLDGQCTARVAERVAAVYAELWWRTPTGNATTRTTGWAERSGWVGPWAWEGLDIDDPAVQPRTTDGSPLLDEVAIERAMTGQRVALTRAERVEAVRRLAAAGCTATVIAQRLVMSGHRVNQLLGQVAA